MDGINTKKLVVNPEEAANIRLMFGMYAQLTTSYGDITRHFAESCPGCGKIITTELDGRNQELLAQIAELTVEAISHKPGSKLQPWNHGGINSCVHSLDRFL